ncbi:hypothetical protein EO238_30815, partial [Citrobacter sp. AAK_AS5]
MGMIYYTGPGVYDWTEDDHPEVICGTDEADHVLVSITAGERIEGYTLSRGTGEYDSNRWYLDF